MIIITMTKAGYGGYMFADNVVNKKDVVELRNHENKVQHILIKIDFKSIVTIDDEGNKTELIRKEN